MATEQTTPAKVTIDCPKCDGKGYIRGFDHVQGGVCFECMGSKKIEIDAMTAAEIVQTKVGHLYYLADIVLAAADDFNDVRAEYYMTHMTEDMFAVGQDAAREVLEYLRQGTTSARKADATKLPPRGGATGWSRWRARAKPPETKPR